MTDPVEQSSLHPISGGMTRLLANPKLIEYLRQNHGIVLEGTPSLMTKPQGTVKLQNQPRWRVLPTGGRDLSNDEKLEMLHIDAVHVTMEHSQLLGVEGYSLDFDCPWVRRLLRVDSLPELEA